MRRSVTEKESTGIAMRGISKAIPGTQRKLTLKRLSFSASFLLNNQAVESQQRHHSNS